MTVAYRLGDLTFDARTVIDLEEQVRGFLNSKGISADVLRDQSEVCVRYPDLDVDMKEDEAIVCNFCTAGRFGKARKVVGELLQKAPWAAEGYRLLAQIEMTEGKFDKALSLAEDAVRLNPSNVYAILLAGNILSRDLNRHAEGLRYFKRCLELAPDLHLAVLNTAACLGATGGDVVEQERLYRKAIQLEPSYLNGYYGLAGILVEGERYREAFDLVQTGLREGHDRPENPARLRQILTEMLVRLSAQLVAAEDLSTIEPIKSELERLGGIKVRVEKDDAQSLPAKLELADRYGRDYHRLAYNPKYAQRGWLYCLAHELEKQILRLESESAGCKARFASLPSNEALFREKTLPYVGDKLRSALPQGEMTGFLAMLMKGLGGQLMNCPLDAFVEKRIFEKYPNLRPVQVIGEYELLQSAIASVKTGAEQGMPRNVVRLSRLLNGISLMVHRDVLGLDFISELELDADQMKLVQRLYGDWKAMAADWRPGDEWNLIRRYLLDLKCEQFFVVVGEDKTEDVSLERERQEKTAAFQERMKSNLEPALKMAILMYMMEALKRFASMTDEQVRQVAFEIAMLGRSGISVDKRSGYSVPSLGNEDMSGPRMLAHYYASWKIAFPERADELGLPFSEEYEQAKAMLKMGK